MKPHRIIREAIKGRGIAKNKMDTPHGIVGNNGPEIIEITDGFIQTGHSINWIPKDPKLTVYKSLEEYQARKINNPDAE